MKKVTRNFLSVLIFLLCIPILCIAGALFFKDKSASFISAGICLLMLAGYLVYYESKPSRATEIVIIAMMSALSVTGRIVFVFLPSLKPCTAIIILTAVYFGRESGFMVGALTALISNFYFGQGGWTPFQMLAWGLTGYFAGLLGKYLSKNNFLLIAYSAISGVFFSLIMDLWSCLWIDGELVWSRYLVLITTSAPFSVAYAISNVVFIILLLKPTQRIFSRLCKKYAIGNYTDTQERNDFN